MFAIEERYYNSGRIEAAVVEIRPEVFYVEDYTKHYSTYRTAYPTRAAAERALPTFRKAIKEA